MLKPLSKFRRADGGLAAIEFALLLPVMVTMFLGCIELTDALACKQKVTGLAATAADLVGQEKNVTNADIANVFSAVNSIVYPYPNSGVKVVISSLVDDGAGGARVAWSDAQNASARSVNSSVPVPAGVIPTGGSVILAEVTYPYVSQISSFLTGTTNLTSTFYSRPRRSATVTRSAT
jgi:Flp pilus assembly protein TadG